MAEEAKGLQQSEEAGVEEVGKVAMADRQTTDEAVEEVAWPFYIIALVNWAITNHGKGFGPHS